MALITVSYFDGGELNIAGTETQAVEDKVNLFIDKYEPDFMLKTLGYPLWKLLKADSYPDPTTQRFIDLLDGGVEFTDSRGHVHNWQGLRSTIQSPVAMYIWYWFQRNNVSYTSVQGETKGKTENSTAVNVSIKQMRLWNEMREIVCQMWAFLKYAGGDTPVYPEFDFCQVQGFKVMTFI